MCAYITRKNTLTLIAFALTLFSRIAFADDIDRFFKERASSPCPVLKWTEEVFKECPRPEPECPKVRTNTLVGYPRTDLKSSFCGFHPKGWPAQECRNRGFLETESADMSVCDSDYVDLGRKRCKICFTCRYPSYGWGTCRSKNCGTERPPQPLEYTSCRRIEFGLEEAIFENAWNTSADGTRLMLRILLVMDEQNAAINQDARELVIRWLRNISSTNQNYEAPLIELGRLFEAAPSSATVEKIKQIIGA